MNFIGRLADGIRKIAAFAEEPAPESRAAIPPEVARQLAESARSDWQQLMKILLGATAPLCTSATALSGVDAMSLRIAGNNLAVGLHGLDWALGAPALPQLRGIGRTKRQRNRVIGHFSLESSAGDTLPVQLESAAAGFVSQATVRVVDGERVRSDEGALDRERHDRATVAVFCAYLREVADTIEQLSLAASSSKAVAALARDFQAALGAVGVKPVEAALGEPPDLRTARIVEYRTGATDGVVVAMTRKGFSYRSEVLRKAEVVVTRLAAQGEAGNGLA